MQFRSLSPSSKRRMREWWKGEGCFWKRRILKVWCRSVSSKRMDNPPRKLECCAESSRVAFYMVRNLCFRVQIYTNHFACNKIPQDKRWKNRFADIFGPLVWFFVTWRKSSWLFRLACGWCSLPLSLLISLNRQCHKLSRTSKLFISFSGSRHGVLPRMIGVILPLPPKLQVVGKARRIEARTTVPQVIMVTEIIRMVVKEPGRMVVEEGNAMTVCHVLERVIKSGRNLRVTRQIIILLHQIIIN